MKEQRIQLVIALAMLAVAAFMLHYHLHPPLQFLSHFWAVFFGAVDAIVVTLLFLSRGTAVWALLLNSFLSFFGIIMMGDIAIVSALQGWIKVSFFQQPFAWLLESTFPYILIAIADFVIGLSLYKITVTAK